MKRGRRIFSVEGLNEFFPKIGIKNGDYTRLDAAPEEGEYDFILESIEELAEEDIFYVSAFDTSYVVSTTGVVTFWATSNGPSYTNKWQLNTELLVSEEEDIYGVAAFNVNITYPYPNMVGDAEGNRFSPGPVFRIDENYNTILNATTAPDLVEAQKDMWSDFHFQYTGGEAAYTWGYSPFSFTGSEAITGLLRADLQSGEIELHQLTSPGIPANGAELNGHQFWTLPRNRVMLWHENETGGIDRFLIDTETLEETVLAPISSGVFEPSLLFYYGEYWNLSAENMWYQEDSYLYIALYSDYVILKFDDESHDLLWSFKYDDELAAFVGEDGDYTDQEYNWSPLVYKGEVYFVSWISLGQDPDTFEYDSEEFMIFKVTTEGEMEVVGSLPTFGNTDAIEQILPLGKYLVLLMKNTDTQVCSISICDVTTGALVHSETIPDATSFTSLPAFAAYSPVSNTGIFFISLDNLIKVHVDFNDFTLTYTDFGERYSDLADNIEEEQAVGVSMNSNNSINIVDGSILYVIEAAGKTGLRRAGHNTIGFDNTEGLTPGFHDPFTDEQYRPPLLHPMKQFNKMMVNGTWGDYYVKSTRVGDDITCEYYTFDGIDFNTKVKEFTVSAPAATYNVITDGIGKYQYLTVAGHPSRIRGRIDVDTGVLTQLPLPSWAYQLTEGYAGGSPVFVGVGTTSTYVSGSTTCYTFNGTSWVTTESLPAYTGTAWSLTVDDVLYVLTNTTVSYMTDVASGWEQIAYPTEVGYTLAFGSSRMMDDSNGNIHFVRVQRTETATGKVDYVSYVLDTTAKTWSFGYNMPDTLANSDNYGSNFSSHFLKYGNIGFINSGFIDMYYVLP